MAVNTSLRPPAYPTVAMAIVIAGTLLMTINMTMVNVALPSMGRDLQAAAGLDWIVAMALLAVVTGALFVLRQVRAPVPLLDMTMFRDRVFSVTIAIVWLATMGHYVVMVLVPVLAQAVYGARALETGLLIAPSALVTALFMPLSGRLSDRIGPRVPVAAGVGLMGLAVWLLMTLPLDPPLARIAVIMAIHGLGVGLSVTPNTVTAMNVVPAALVGQASAMRAVNRQASAALSVAIVAGVITFQAGGLAPAGVEPGVLLGAYQLAFAILLVPVLAGALVALALPGRLANEAIQRHRMEEHMAVATD